MIVLTKEEQEKEIRLLKKAVQEKKKNMNNIDAIKILMNTGMYTKRGKLKAEFR